MQLDDFKKLDQLEQWQTIMGFSAKMIEVSRDGNWEQLQNMDVMRRQLMECFFAEQPKGKLAEQVGRDIQHILEVDKAIVELVKAARDIIPQQMNKLNQARKATVAYSENA
jgi:hypothetical protein